VTWSAPAATGRPPRPTLDYGVASLRSRSFPSAEATTRPVLACRAEETWDWWASFKDPNGSTYDPGL